MRLTQRQLLFVEHYIQSGGRGAQAAKAAGYTGNPGTLAAMATQNLNTPHVRDEIRRRQDEIKFRSEIDTQAKRMKLWAKNHSSPLSDMRCSRASSRKARIVLHTEQV